MASAYAIDDARSLAEVLSLAIAQAGLSVDDEPVGRAQRVLAQEMFVNAYTMRFKRQRTGGWDWLQKEPFRLPMCLADLIGHCLDQELGGALSLDAYDVETAAAAAATDVTGSKGALRFLLGDGCHQDGGGALSEPSLFSPGSATPVGSTPTLAAIRLGQLDGAGDSAAVDFARHVPMLLDDEGDALDKRSRSESPPRPRRSLTKSRNPSTKRSRSSRSGKPTPRQPQPPLTITRPAAAAELSPPPALEPPPPPPPVSEKTVSPLKVAKPAVRDGSTSGRASRRSGRESSLVRAMTAMLKHMAEPLPFSIEMVRTVPILEDDQSSCDSYSSDSSGSEIDEEGRRLPSPNARSTSVKVDASPNVRDYPSSASKRREADRPRVDQQNGVGISPKRKRLNYSSDR